MRSPLAASAPLLFAAATAFGLGCGDEAQPLSAPTLDGLELTAEPAMLTVDETFRVTVLARYSDGSTPDVTGEAVFEVEDDTVVESLTGGRFRAADAGTTTIRARMDEAEGALSVTVMPAPLVGLELVPSDTSVEVNESRVLRALGSFADGARTAVNDQVVWSSSDPSVVAVEGGTVTGLAPGRATVTAEANGISASADVRVREPRLVELELEGPEAPIPAGQRATVVATGLFSSGSTVTVNAQLEWRSSDPDVARVSEVAGEEGVVIAESEGRTTITALDPETTLEAAVTVRVAPPTLVAVEVRPGQAELAAGEIVILSAVGVFSDGSSLDMTRDVSWRSSDPSVAAVNNSGFEKGRVSGLSAGTAVIDVTEMQSGLTSEASMGGATLTVNPPNLLTIGIEPRTSQVVAGLTEQLRARGNFSDGTSRILTSSLSWSSSSPMIASVNETGLVTGRQQGMATVRVTEQSSGISSGSASAELTILPPELLTLDLDQTQVGLVVGQTGGLAASGDFTDGVNRDVSARVGWSSNAPAVLRVGAGGSLSGLAAGTATVTARDSATQLTARAVVTVEPLRLLRIDLTPGTVTLPVGAEVALTASGAYNDGQNRDLTGSVQWTSNATVADVATTGSLAGLVRALSAGQAVLSATDASSGVVGRSTVTVDGRLSLQTLAVSVPTTTMRIGQQEQATALGTYSDGNTYALTHSVVWDTGDPTVLEVSNVAETAGRLTGRATGTSTVGAGIANLQSSNTPNVEVRLGEITRNWSGPTRTVDGTSNYGVSVASFTVSQSDIGAGSASVTDVDVRVNFLKTDGSCASPSNGFAYHNETNFRLDGPGNRQVVLAQPNTWSGGTAISPVTVTFDQAASGSPSGTPTSGTYRPNGGNLNNFNGVSPVGTWTLRAGDTAGADPLCVIAITVTLRMQ